MKIKHIVPLVVALVSILGFITGCGSTDGGIKDWQTPAPVIKVSNIQGTVLPPAITANRKSAFLLNSVTGTKVYLEENPSYASTVDNNGNFIIKSVPAGKYHVIAETNVGISTYRQRSDQINLTGEFQTQTLATSMQLIEAPYRVTFTISDIASGKKLPGVTLTLWGHQYFTDTNGTVTIGPMPDGMWPIKAETAGYLTANFVLGFKELRKSVLEVKMTPLTQADKNQAPTVEIEQSFKTITTNGTGQLSAFGFDPDGDYINYSWETTAGSLSQNQGATTILTAPPSSSTLQITLTGDDRKGGVGKAVLEVNVLSGGFLPPNPNNKPPLAPTDPIPADISTNLGTDIVLRWSASDPDGDSLTYDLFFAPAGQEVKLLASDLKEPSYHINQLNVNQLYYWQVIARDSYGAISPAPQMWQFTTGDQNNFSPYQPSNPVPADLSVEQLTTLLFTWTGGDPDLSDTVTYTFLIGTDSSNLQIATKSKKLSYEASDLLNGQTYYWQIIAADNRGKETKGAVWQFTTYALPNNPPGTPAAILPASGTTNVDVDTQVRWTCSDPDGDHLTYDFFFGEKYPLTKMGEGLDAPVFNFTDYLKYSTKYLWQVVARDDEGAVNDNSPVWSFTTRAKVNTAPNVPQALNPANLSANVALRPVFSWSGDDPDGDAVTYDFYLDTVSPPVTVKGSDLTAKSWTPQTDLTAGTKYYWKIVAKDTSAHIIESQIFSFFTATEAGGDTVAPTIISVEPEDGSTGIANSAAVRIIFSEPMNKTSVESALSFLPDLPGSWTWENDATIRFWPSNPWPNGSYHKLTMAANMMRDKAGNLITTSKTNAFTVSADLPLPNGYRSMGFPLKATSGNNVNVGVPELPSGAVSYAAVIAEDNAVNVTVKANKLASWYKSSPEAAFRELERCLADKKTPEIMVNKRLRASTLPVSSQQVGTVTNFYIPANGGVATTTAYPGNIIQAECVGVTNGVYMYIDKSILNPDYNLISEVRKRFEESIQPKVRDVFGNEPDVGPDGDSHLTILLTDAMADGIAGIFYSVDLFANDSADPQLRESNGRKLFYMKYSLSSDITRYGTVAHEFQHMVNFWQKRTNGGSNVFEETWLNEGLSKFSEEVCGYGMPQGDSNTARLVKLSQQNYKTLSLTNWNGINSYGLSYLFVRFIAQENRYGTTYRDVTRQLVQSALVGKANVEAVTGEPFKNTLARWYLSLLLNDYTSTDPNAYGLAGLNLEGAYGGEQLYGFKPEEMYSGQNYSVSIPAWGGALFKKSSTGSALTTMDFTGINSTANIWLIDKRQ